MNLYSIQYIAIILLLDKIFNMNLDLAKRSKEVYSKFLRFNEDLIRFINNHQFIKGFQISTKDFYKADSRIISSIEEYISLQISAEQTDLEYETIELKDIMDDVPEFFVRTISEIKKRTYFESLVDKNVYESPSEKIKKDEYFHNVFKSEFDCDEGKYHKMVYMQVKESTQNTKKQLANLVGSDKRKITIKNGKEIKLLIKNSNENLKQPILSLGEEGRPSTTPKKMRLSNFNTLNFIPSPTSGSSSIKKIKSETDNPRPRDRKKSMVPVRRKTNNGQSKPSIDFEPDFDDAIFETFPNSYSFDFKVEKIWSFKDDGNSSNNKTNSSTYK